MSKKVQKMFIKMISLYYSILPELCEVSVLLLGNHNIEYRIISQHPWERDMQYHCGNYKHYSQRNINQPYYKPWHLFIGDDHARNEWCHWIYSWDGAYHVIEADYLNTILVAYFLFALRSYRSSRKMHMRMLYFVAFQWPGIYPQRWTLGKKYNVAAYLVTTRT